jgi:hypothetical protein
MSWVYVLLVVALFTATIAWFGSPRGTSRRVSGDIDGRAHKPGSRTREPRKSERRSRPRLANDRRRDRTWGIARHTAAFEARDRRADLPRLARPTAPMSGHLEDLCGMGGVLRVGRSLLSLS